MLGQWAQAGGNFKGGSEIILISAQGGEIAKGTLIKYNLFKIQLQYFKHKDATSPTMRPQYGFVTQEHQLTWETWHKCFRHISYMGLGKLHSQKLVNGFHVIPISLKPKCPTCTAVKHLRQPFGPSST